MAEQTNATDVQVKSLPAEVAAKYDLTDIPAGKNILSKKFGNKTVDFSTISLEQADALAKVGFPHLKLKQAAGAAPSNTAAPLGNTPAPAGNASDKKS